MADPKIRPHDAKLDETYEAPHDMPREATRGIDDEGPNDPHWIVHPETTKEQCAQRGETPCPSPLEYAVAKSAMRAAAQAFHFAAHPRPTTFTGIVHASAKPGERVKPLHGSISLAALAARVGDDWSGGQLAGTLELSIDANLGAIATIHGGFKEGDAITKFQELELFSLISVYGMEVFHDAWNAANATGAKS